MIPNYCKQTHADTVHVLEHSRPIPISAIFDLFNYIHFITVSTEHASFNAYNADIGKRSAGMDLCLFIFSSIVSSNSDDFPLVVTD